MSRSLEYRRERRTLEARLRVLQDEVGAVRGVSCDGQAPSDELPTFRTAQPTGSIQMPRHIESARLAILENEARLLAAE